MCTLLSCQSGHHDVLECFTAAALQNAKNTLAQSLLMQMTLPRHFRWSSHEGPSERGKLSAQRATPCRCIDPFRACVGIIVLCNGWHLDVSSALSWKQQDKAATFRHNVKQPD